MKFNNGKIRKYQSKEQAKALEEMGVKIIYNSYYEEAKDDPKNLLQPAKSTGEGGYNLVPGQVKDITNAKETDYRTVTKKKTEETKDGNDNK